MLCAKLKVITPEASENSLKDCMEINKLCNLLL